MEKNTQISCPKCGESVIVEDVLAKSIEEKYRNKLNQEYSKLKEKYENESNTLKLNFEKERKALVQKELELQKAQADVERIVFERLKQETHKKEKEIRGQVNQEFELQIKALNQENEERRKQVQELRKTEIENQQLKRNLEEQRQVLEVEFERKMTARLQTEAENAAKRANENAELKIKEKDMLIENLKHQMDEMKRRAEQGSMQLQGEAQELALEELLKTLFITDDIEEVGKGVRGADIIQTVRNKFGMECGKILYESKRTKHFNDDWIEKLKNDTVAVKADISVIVTEALPEGIDKIGCKDGVWICTYFDLKGLAMVLRESLIKINQAFNTQANKGEKMQMLYDYLTSNEFRLQLGAIVEGFTSLKDSYEKEKLAMARIWKEREKQLERILLNTNHFIGSIQGIAGNSIPEIQLIGGGAPILLDE